MTLTSLPYLDIFYAISIAEILFVLVNRKKITILVKNNKERTKAEIEQVKRGLKKEIACDGLLFTPLSTVFALMIFYPLLDNFTNINKEINKGIVTGLIGFFVPLALVKAIVLRIARTTLKEFSEIMIKERENGLIEEDLIILKKPIETEETKNISK